ncbi:MAG: flavin monoamine oxidase family protein [Rickettsiales bacterium]
MHTLNERILPSKRRKSIAIIGGGLTGLMTAKELQEQGFAVTVFEEDARLGGHIKTVMAPHEGLMIESGAELISGKHEHVLKLAQELGLEVQPLSTPDNSADTGTLLHFGGQVYTQSEFESTFAILAQAIAQDESELYFRTDLPIDSTRDIPWNRHVAEKLDAMSLRDYLLEKKQQLHVAGNDIPDWLIEAIATSYGGEIGQDAERISALTFVTMLNTSLLRSGNAQGLEMPGEEDQIYRIRGGNEALIGALVDRVLSTAPPPNHFHRGGGVIRHSSPVTHVQQIPRNRVSVTYQNHGQLQTEQFDGLVTTMSMSALRQIPGMQHVLQRHSTASEDVDIIETMQESDVSKITFQTRLPPAQLLATLNDGKAFEGIIYTDSGPQTIWVSSSNQRTTYGKPPRGGLITCYVCGETSRLAAPEKAALCEKAILQMLQSRDATLTRNAIFTDNPPVVSDWVDNLQGCFASPAPGQFLPLCDFNPYHGNIVTTGSFLPLTVNNPTTEEGFDIDIQLGYMNNAINAAKQAANHLTAYYAKRSASVPLR